MALTEPAMSEVNLTPSSAEFESEEKTVGLAAGLKRLKPCSMTVTVVPAEGVSRLPLSSTARVLMVMLPGTAGTQLNDQVAEAAALARVAGCQVWPPSTESSTPATTPP